MRAALLVVAIIAIGARHASALVWAKGARDCEPPNVFYDPQVHEEGRPPCCPLANGVCPYDAVGDIHPPGPGGPSATCPPSTHICHESPNDHPAVQPNCTTAVPNPAPPNIIMFLTDDQASCAYGDASECYSTKTARAIPAALTPNLDALADYGTVFPVAHNTANWCNPSLNGIISARYHKNFHTSAPDRYLTTYPMALRSLGEHPNIVSADRDDYDDDKLPFNVIGGYCTYFAGKFVPKYVDAYDKGRGVGDLKAHCTAVGSNEPDCTPNDEEYPPSMNGLFEFMSAMKFTNHGLPTPTAQVQPFFAWHFPFLPHDETAKESDASVQFLFGTPPAYTTGVFGLASNMCGAAPGFPLHPQNDVCVAAAGPFLEEDKGGNGHRFFGSTWLADRNLGEILEFLEDHDLDSNTVIMHLSDNPWFMYQSKKKFAENGYRTRIIVYDPRVNAPSGSLVPDSAARTHQRTVFSRRVNPDPVHSNDLLPTVLDLATNGTKTTCPETSGNGVCDGRDLVPYLMNASGEIPGLAGAPHMRDSMCGHQTSNPTKAAAQRFLITAPHRTGRCYLVDTGSCPAPMISGSTLLPSDPGHDRYAGHCVLPVAFADPSCTAGIAGQACDPSGGAAATEGHTGGLCLGGKCRAAPACLEDTDCTGWFGSESLAGWQWQCAFPDDPSTATRDGHVGWCRNRQNQACNAHDDCPPCAANAEACERICIPRVLKGYAGPLIGGGAKTALTDLLLDPNELNHPTSPHAKKLGLLDQAPAAGTVAYDMGLDPPDPTHRPYESTLRRLNCCMDDWYPQAPGATECGTTPCGDLVCEDG